MVLVRKRQRRLLLLVAQGAVALALARAFRAPRHEQAGSRAQHGRGTSRTSWVRSAAASDMIQDSRTAPPEPLAEQHVRDDRQQRGEPGTNSAASSYAPAAAKRSRACGYTPTARHHDGAQERRDMRAGERRERQSSTAHQRMISSITRSMAISIAGGKQRHEDATKMTNRTRSMTNVMARLRPMTPHTYVENRYRA